MKNPSDRPDASGASPSPSHDDYLQFRLDERERLQAYIEQNVPSLAAAYRREVGFFSDIVDTAIEPALSAAAESAHLRGWYTRVARENLSDGIFGVATPGIRLFVSRRPLPDLTATGCTEPVSFIGFHGTCPDHLVQMVVDIQRELSSDNYGRSERTLSYEDLSAEHAKRLISQILLKAGIPR